METRIIKGARFSAGAGQPPARPAGGPAGRQATASAGINLAETPQFPGDVRLAQCRGRPGVEGAGPEGASAT